MKQYSKPTMTMAKFDSKEAIAAGSVYQFVEVDTSDSNGPVTVYEIESFGGAS